MFLLLSLALAAAPADSSQGGPPGGRPPGGHPPPLVEIVLHELDELELDDAARQAVDRLATSAKASMDADRSRARTAHDALDAALAVDVPNRATVLAAARAFEAADAQMKERELGLIVDIAATIGPDAWAELRDRLPPPGAPHGGRHGEHGRPQGEEGGRPADE